jgi:hypothetical protein
MPEDAEAGRSFKFSEAGAGYGGDPASSRLGVLHPAQVCAWRAMGPEKKWSLVRQANRLLRETVRSRLQRTSPGRPDDVIDRETSRFLLTQRT